MALSASTHSKLVSARPCYLTQVFERVEAGPSGAICFHTPETCFSAPLLPEAGFERVEAESATLSCFHALKTYKLQVSGTR